MESIRQAHDTVAAVRAALVESSFTVGGVADLLGDEAYAAMDRGAAVPGRRVLRDSGRGDSALAVLVRLFLFGDRVPLDAVAAALPLEAMRVLGLVAVSGDAVVAVLDLRPYGEPDTDWWVVSDRPPGGGQDWRVDHVLGVGGASTTLARVTPRMPAGRALDIGTGCGVQALHLTRHCADVTVTDVNPRALALAELTAGLSGVSWRPRVGSLLDPVAGERFDLVVSNPPFVVSPGVSFTYRDAGLPADDLGRRLLAEIPRHLADGGWAVVLANWLHVRGQDWRDRVTAWVDGTGCDAWIVQREVQDPAEYAEMWLRDADEHRRDTYSARYDEWLTVLEEMGAEAVGFGWVVLRAAGRHESRVEVEELAGATRLPRGDEVVAQFEVADRLESLGAAGLLAARPRMGPDARVVITRVGSALLPVSVGTVGGWRPDVLLDATLHDLVGRLDGTTTVDDAIDAVCRERGADRLDLLAAALPALRALVTAGPLHP